jgi:hypothetical protein
VIKLVTDENFHGAIYPERAETGTLSLSDGGQPMKTLSVRTTIGPDGSIDLHITEMNVLWEKSMELPK